MNNSDLYLPSATGSNPILKNRAILSDFFPSVEIN